jgi:hypothetical protein
MASIQPDRTRVLVPGDTLAAAGTYTGPEMAVPFGTTVLAVLAKFVRIGGGTTVDAYVQTSLDGGVTWCDVMNLTFATTTANKVSAVRTDIALAAGITPTDATLADNTILDGVLGDRIRCKYVVVGTYTGASLLTVSAVMN